MTKSDYRALEIDHKVETRTKGVSSKSAAQLFLFKFCRQPVGLAHGRTHAARRNCVRYKCNVVVFTVAIMKLKKNIKCILLQL